MCHKGVHEAQELFRALKNKLQAEYKRMATGRGSAALSDVESRFYKPAIDDAWANTLLAESAGIPARITDGTMRSGA
jgi:hypothetical protein